MASGDGETSRPGSRDPVDDGAKCGSHGARRARRSREQGAGADVAAKSRNKARSSRLSGRRKRKTCGLKLGVEVVRPRAGFGGLPTKPSVEGFSVWASKPSPKAQHDGDGIRVCREASKRRTRDVIAVLASRGREVRWRRGRPMALPTTLPECPLGVCIFTLSCRGSLDFRPSLLH